MVTRIINLVGISRAVVDVLGVLLTNLIDPTICDLRFCDLPDRKKIADSPEASVSETQKRVRQYRQREINETRPSTIGRRIRKNDKSRNTQRQRV